MEIIDKTLLKKCAGAGKTFSFKLEIFKIRNKILMDIMNGYMKLHLCNNDCAVF